MPPRTRRPVVLVTLAAAATLAALVPAASASASSTPLFAYVDTGSGDPAHPERVLAVASADGSGATALTPPGFQVHSYDVTADGSTLVVAGRAGAATADRYDATYGLVRVHRDPATGAVTRTLLSAYWDANPVLSVNGTRVYWSYRGTLYGYDAATGATTALSSAFAPAAGEAVTRLAVRDDGTSPVVAAVVVANVSAGTARVLAGPVAGPVSCAPSYAAPGLPTAGPFVWTDPSTLAVGLRDATSGTTGTVLVPLAGCAQQPVPALQGFYDLRPDADGGWWAWSDANGTSSVSSVAAPVTTASTPSAGATRGNGATTSRYAPVSVAPPVLDGVDARAASHASLVLSASVVPYGRTVAYAAVDLYGAPPGTAYSPASAAEVDRGTLQASADGVHFATALTTSGSSPFVLGSRFYNAYYPRALTRNTWFRWVFPGDLLVAAGVSPVQLVKVVPVVSVKVAVSGRSRVVYGAASRSGGVAVLYRKVGTRLVKVAVTAVTAKGAYSFGRRALPRGTYRVATVADRSWASGFRVVTF